MVVCVKDRIDLKAELKLDEKPHPEERWEGKFLFHEDDKPPVELFLRARLLFGGGLVEGQGGFTHEGAHMFDAAVTGEVAAAAMTFNIWVDGLETVHGRLDCTGELKAEGDNLVGFFTYPCLQPGKCPAECEGGKGDFDLVKVVD